MSIVTTSTPAPKRRRGIKKKTGLSCCADQERYDAVQSWRKLSRLVKMNFSSTAGDLFISLSFNENVTQEHAFKYYYQFVRRIKQTYKRKMLPPCKFILLKEDHSGKQHAHVFINAGLSLPELRQLWPCGTLEADVIEDTQNRVELEKYMQKQHGQESGGGWSMEQRRFRQRRWTTSRNLETFWK